MAKIPVPAILPKSATKLVNTIRLGASQTYRDYVPEITASDEQFREVGRILMDNPNLLLEFQHGLVGRIAFELIHSKLFYNPWRSLKRGDMEMGEKIEEIFVNIARGNGYDPIEAEKNVFKRTDADIRTAFHVHNFYGVWKDSIYPWQIKKAFLSMNGVIDLVSAIITSMYSGVNITEFHAMKYAIGRHILEGNLFPKKTPPVSPENTKAIVTSIKALGNLLELTPSTEYNVAGVENDTPKEDQILIVNTDFDAMIDVEVLAAAFNMSKAEFMAQRILIDGFGKVDEKKLTGEDGSLIIPGFVPFTEEEKEKLNSIPAIMIDRNMFMCYDVETTMLDIVNPSGNWTNYFLHVRKIISLSPFANGLILTSGDPGITSVTVTPGAVNARPGMQVMFEADTVAVNWAMRGVEWAVTGAENGDTQISRFGVLHIAEGESAETLTITATSIFDKTKKGTATVALT